MEKSDSEKRGLFKKKKKDPVKNFIIKIHGKAISSDTTDLNHVKTFDNFVIALFDKYRNQLLKEFEKENELSYEKEDAKRRMIDPYLHNFQINSVTKDVQA